MLDKFRSILIDKCQLDPGKPILAGVSGGPDSICLLDILRRLDYKIIVAHFNHQLRAESSGEAQELQKYVDGIGLQYLESSKDVQGHAEAFNLTIEEAARKLRYNFLFQQAAIYRAQAVAVGHNADDQVETVLMNLFRGTGLSGLRGMAYYTMPNPWSQSIPLVRPLLGTWRQAILEYVILNDLRFFEDQTNTETRFLRNRLRQEIIPYLEDQSPNLRRRLWQTAEIIKDDYQAIESLVTLTWQECSIQDGKEYVCLSIPAVLNQPVSIQRYLVRKAMKHIHPNIKDVDFETVERCLELLNFHDRDTNTDLIDGLQLFIEDDLAWFAEHVAKLPYDNWPQILPGKTYTLEAPGLVCFPSGWQIETRIISAPEFENKIYAALNNQDPFQAWFDIDKINMPIEIRARLPGDRIQALGLNEHSIKISDLMINCKVPKRARRDWPLLVADDLVIWVPGLRLAHPYRVQEDTKSLLYLQLKRKRL